MKCIDVYQIINPELKFGEIKSEGKMLFTYNDIKNDFDRIIKKWFSNYEKFEAPFNLVLGQFYISKYYLEGLFINIANAAESFHARLDLKNDIPKTQQDREHNDKLERVIICAPEDLQNWVKSKISPKPPYYYDTRLKYLLKEFSNSELDNMIGNHDTFINKIKNSRDYYTHYNSKGKEKAAEGQELIDLYFRLRLLIICGFLMETGFEKTLLEKLIKEKTYNMFRDLMG